MQDYWRIEDRREFWNFLERFAGKFADEIRVEGTGDWSDDLYFVDRKKFDYAVREIEGSKYWRRFVSGEIPDRALYGSEERAEGLVDAVDVFVREGHTNAIHDWLTRYFENDSRQTIMSMAKVVRKAYGY